MDFDSQSNKFTDNGNIITKTQESFEVKNNKDGKNKGLSDFVTPGFKKKKGKTG